MTTILKEIKIGIIILVAIKACNNSSVCQYKEMSIYEKTNNGFLLLEGNSCDSIPIGIWHGEYKKKKYNIRFEKGRINQISTNEDFIWVVAVKDRKLDGLFSYKYFPTAIPHITGQFEKGKKVGKWEYLWFDKSPWVEIDYGTVNNPKRDTLLYKPRPKGERENYLEALKKIRLVEELEYNTFQQSLLKKREKEIRESLRKDGFDLPQNLNYKSDSLKEAITKRYRKSID